MGLAADWKAWPIVRLLSDLRFGVTLMALVLAYASIMSALPQVRGALEMSEMAAFGHWLFVVLVLLLCLSVTVATFARIRFNLLNLGVLTVHAGILILCGGALWYFGTKIEGDVLLRTPRIELLSVTGQTPRTIASFPSQVGQNWANTMPAFGGTVSLAVVASDPPQGTAPGRVVVEARLGDAPPTRIELRSDDPSPRPLGDRLALRWMSFPPERTFYDHERAALFLRPDGADQRGGWEVAEIRGLPLFRERYLDEGYVVGDTEGHPVPSKRQHPALAMGPLAVPTGWFERWRMPIDVRLPGAPFDAQVTGYLPYIAGLTSVALPGGAALNPALSVHLALPGTSQRVNQTLFALDPAGSRLDLDAQVEFRWATTPQEIEQWLTPLAGTDELYIELKDPPLSRRVAIREGETIKLDGTPYELSVQQFFPNWPLMSPGFEKTTSPAALVAVTAGEKRFTRTVIQRFPALSQDIDDQGTRRREGLLDDNLLLRYRSARGGALLFVADAASAAAGQCYLGVFDAGGAVDRRTLHVGRAESVRFGSGPLDITVAQLIEKARRVLMPVIEPLERRQVNVAARGASAIRLKFTGRGPLAGWSDTQWAMFSQYPDDEARPIVVRPPGTERGWELVYSRVPHDLGAQLFPGALSVDFFPGRRSAETWRSDFQVQPDGAARPVAGSVQTNDTFAVGAWTLFQSGAARDHWTYTVLGVGNRRGIWPMLLGCVMITLGCLYAFYVKPVLRQRRQERALAVANARRRETVAAVAGR